MVGGLKPQNWERDMLDDSVRCGYDQDTLCTYVNNLRDKKINIKNK